MVCKNTCFQNYTACIFLKNKQGYLNQNISKRRDVAYIQIALVHNEKTFLPIDLEGNIYISDLTSIHDNQAYWLYNHNPF